MEMNAIATGISIALDEYEIPKWLESRTLKEVLVLTKRAYNRGLL